MQSGSTPTIVDEFKDIEIPDAEEMALEFETLVQQGVITPEQAEVMMAEESQMNGILLDPNLKQNQMNALAGLQDISDSGGMTAMDKANLNKIKTQEATAARGAREAILQNAQARGAGGSGMELMAQLQNAQASADRTSQRDMDIAGMAQQRALDALMKGGQMSGQMIDQSFGQQAQTAGANDAISRFNAANQTNMNQFNTAANNQAQQANLQEKQRVNDTNAQIANQQQQYNNNQVQQQFNNRMTKAGGQNQVNTNNSSNKGRDSQASADASNQTTGTMMSMFGAMMSDERCKEQIEDFNASDFLDSLTPHKYQYKDKQHGEGQKAGVMAQDLEKSDVGAGMVMDTPDGKMIDGSQALGPILASLADLNRRVKDDEEGI